jgi:N-acetylneuraminic acid mutarotase
VNGGGNQIGIYGTQGTPAAGNIPGSRWGATARMDAAGNVWLFAGYGYGSTIPAAPLSPTGLLNDLWKLDAGTGQWTWVSGSNTINPSGSYGVKGTPALTNVPGPRQAHISWIDGSGNFWLFGGFDLDSTGSQAALNDLWEFSAGQWTWVSGANVANQTGVYGAQGVAAATNVPGARWSSAAWADASGSLWLFGGQGYDSTGNGSLSDVWKYDLSVNQWIWEKGPGSVSQAGLYGLVPGPIIYPFVGDDPGSRFAPGYWYVFDPGTQSSYFWIFGGEGFDTAGTNGNRLLSDLWRYLPYP